MRGVTIRFTGTTYTAMAKGLLKAAGQRDKSPWVEYTVKGHSPVPEVYQGKPTVRERTVWLRHGHGDREPEVVVGAAPKLSPGGIQLEEHAETLPLRLCPGILKPVVQVAAELKAALDRAKVAQYKPVDPDILQYL